MKYLCIYNMVCNSALFLCALYSHTGEPNSPFSAKLHPLNHLFSAHHFPPILGIIFPFTAHLHVLLATSRGHQSGVAKSVKSIMKQVGKWFCCTVRLVNFNDMYILYRSHVNFQRFRGIFVQFCSVKILISRTNYRTPIHPSWIAGIFVCVVNGSDCLS